MNHIPYAQRGILAPLFTTYKRQRVIIDAVLEQPYGEAIADANRDPQFARLHLGAFTLFAGDPAQPQAEAMIRTCPRGLLIAETHAWKERILYHLGAKCTTYTRFGFSHDSLSLDHVRELARRIPEGYAVRRVDHALAPQIIDETDYRDIDTFLERGVGCCALSDDRVASAALAYTNSNNGIEIQIYTEENHQRKGLATVTGAALIAHCLERNIAPHWSAANATSAHLAQKLGYVQNDQYDAIVYRP